MRRLGLLLSLCPQLPGRMVVLQRLRAAEQLQEGSGVCTVSVAGSGRSVPCSPVALG